MTKFSVAELERLSAEDDAEAIKELSVRYATGNGVEKDGTKSLDLLRRAVDMDDAGAMFMMGAAYATGVGVPIDEAQAVMWYEKAAAKGNALGQYWLAIMIGNSRGNIVGSWAAAAPLFEKAAMQGHSDAAFMLGWIHQMGETGKIDYEQAANWYRKASETVLNQKAQFNLR
ncbi:MAG: tetratricopeptide repeat protein, partial [Rhodospirillaceae bacterium]|nr:tetratricopeptide repeat protein [Rhodospirillaceae bacterium]